LAVQEATREVLRQTGESVDIKTVPDNVDAYSAAVDLAAQYHLDFWEIYGELRRLYDTQEIPIFHLRDLSQQIEKQICNYEVREERVERALALVRTEGFQCETGASGAEIYTAEIIYPKDREDLLMRYEDLRDNHGNFGFHYTPYNFDSNPEKSFFEQMLMELNQNPDEVEDIYFTGALTDPAKTDFFIEYKDDKGKWRRYTPDFVIRRRDGRTLIVEIKREHDRQHPVDGEWGRKALALRKWEDLNPDRLRYRMIFASETTVSYDDLTNVRALVWGSNHD